jgi:4-carboxymuconolactone decarboxylase
MTRAQDVIIHLAFCAGWPKAMSAIVLAKELFSPEEEPER